MHILFNVKSQDQCIAWDWSCRLKFRVYRGAMPHPGLAVPSQTSG